MVGPTLAHYRILEKIGSGGMGDVYLAEDTKLDRKVALKVLPPELAESEERRARFQREAKAIAALDHPNIVQVFSVEEAVGTHFITMQLVQGKTLTELLPKNGFPLSKLFDIAIPLTDAVAAAHQEGFTHRDLKPDNVMVSEDGRVKVLDFGLAKPTRGFAVSTEAATIAKTGEGMIVGTVAYMSPEQAEGKPVDHRSDVFSLGVVLYEMATGEHPFQGDTAASVMTAITQVHGSGGHRDQPRTSESSRENHPSMFGKGCGAPLPDGGGYPQRARGAPARFGIRGRRSSAEVETSLGGVGPRRCDSPRDRDRLAERARWTRSPGACSLHQPCADHVVSRVGKLAYVVARRKSARL